MIDTDNCDETTFSISSNEFVFSSMINFSNAFAISSKFNWTLNSCFLRAFYILLKTDSDIFIKKRS